MTLPDPDRDPANYAGWGLLLLVGGLALAGWTTLVLAPVGLALCVASTYSRQHGWLLLGPLAEWEMVRAARRGRVFLYRGLLLAGVLFYLSLVFAGMNVDRGQPWWTVFTAPGKAITPARASQVGIEVFNTFGVCTALFVAGSVVVGLSPVIAEERERNRLDHLLVTDLRSREILLGKMIARLGVTAGYVLLILPVLALMTLLGGIDPVDATVFGTIALLALLGLTGCALMATAEPTAKPSGSVGICVAATFLFLFVTVLPLGAANWIVTWSWLGWAADPLLWLCRFVSSGNPFVALSEIMGQRAIGAGGGPGRGLVTVLCHYAAIQVLWFAIGLATAADGLRKEMKPTTAATAPKPVVPWPQKPKKPVSDEPVRWQEVEYNTTRGFILSGWRRKLEVIAGFVGVTLVSLAVIGLLIGSWFFPDVRRGLHTLFACTGGFAVFIVTLPTLWIASRGVAREWEKDTLEALRVTALTPGEILSQKWWGALDLTQPVLLFAFAWLGLGVISLALPLPTAFACAGLIGANWFAAASVGVWIAVRCKKLAQAGWQFVGLLFVVYFFGSIVIALASRGGFGMLAAATIPPVAEAFGGLFAHPQAFERAARRHPGGSGMDDNWPSLLVQGAAVMVAFVSCWLWSRVAWRSAAARFTRDMTPAPDGPPP